MHVKLIKDNEETATVNIDVKETSDGKISLNDVIEILEIRGDIKLDCDMEYYDPVTKEYCSIDNEDKYLSLQELKGEITLKISENESEKSDDSKLTKKSRRKTKRTKERKIKDVVDKVAQWRKLYIGTYDENGTMVKYNLDKAADMVGIAKKTLDDYLLQIQAGRKYGFDFNKNSEAKIGMLRSYIKSAKEGTKISIN